MEISERTSSHRLMPNNMQEQTQNEPVVELRNVTYAVASDGPRIIDNLSLEVRRGETLVLLGESGCGKTTTLRLINGLAMPTTGDVFVEGRNTRACDAIALRRRTGYVIQDAGLFPHFTVARNIGLVPSLEKWPEEKIRARVAELLALVGLDPQKFSERFPSELSGGQRQRVGVARALAADPPLLLLDEPFGALDPLTRAALQREFVALQKRLDKSAVFVTHDVREALTLGTRVGLMHAGRLVVLAAPDAFMRSDEPLARRYVETLRMPEGALS